MNPDPTVADLLLEWEERAEQGNPISAEALCQTCPEKLPELKRQIARLRAVSPVLDLVAPPLAVPGFELLDEIGGGGMGVVFKARDLTLDRIVAIKVPRPAALISHGARARFEREARVLAQLRHPHVVKIHSADLVQGRPFIVMDFVAGGNLTRRLASYRGDPVKAVSLVETIARAVDHAHQVGVIHRDLKPSNILLDEQDHPLVGDFGVAGFREPDPVVASPDAAGPDDANTPIDGTLTRTNDQIGTPSYMAPEQFVPQGGPLERTADVWALGVILYELLTGQLPFRAANGHPLAWVVCHAAPPRPRVLRLGLDGRLEAIVLKCLAKEPARRYPSAAALAAALASWTRARRRWRTGRFAVGIALPLAAAALAGFYLFWPPLPEDRHEALVQPSLQTLDQGEAVQLIPARGGPASYLVRAGLTDLRAGLDDDGAFHVFAPKVALVELIPDSRTDHYQITGEVREDGCFRDAELGIYYAYHGRNTENGIAHVLGVAKFADLGPRAFALANKDNEVGSQFVLNQLLYVEPGPPLTIWSEYNGPTVWYKPPRINGPGPGPWRTLTIRVTPEVVSATFDSLALNPFRQSWVKTWAEILANEQPFLNQVPPDVNKRGGIGLYVNGCQASFRNFRLVPFSKP